MQQHSQRSIVDSIQSESLAEFPNIQHGFFTRLGGVSKGLYKSLNCGFGSGDSRHNVSENRTRVARTFGLESVQLLTARQTHSADAVMALSPWKRSESPEGDAIVSSASGFGIAVLTADCAPVLLADPNAPVIASAHAGWKGALAGILTKTVTKMTHFGAQLNNIHAVIGPTLSPEAYEVGPEFRDLFLTSSPQNACFFKQGTGDRFLFDLPGFIRLCLSNCGVLNISDLDLCTYGCESDFFSYRRSVHHRERDYGRQISVIRLV